MSNHYSGPDDATQPIQHPQDPRFSGRQPYQFPGGMSQGPVRPGPGAPPQVAPRPGMRPGQMGGRPGSGPARKPKGSLRRRGCAIGCLGVLAVLLIAIVFLASTVPPILDFGRTISTKEPLGTETAYMSTSTRTNLLILGYGGGDHPGANLTDSLVTVSMIPSTNHTSLVSVPRDLWVQYPVDSGIYRKINSVYATASEDGANREAGAEATAEKISSVTGLDVQYWMMIDFNGFEKLIDSLGGIDVHVPNGFTANYPKNDNPDIDATVIQVKFEKGTHHFTGKEAIQYSRARDIIDNPAEIGDFARAARQQIILKSTLSAMQNSGNWPRLFDAMEALKGTIYTNMTLLDLGLFTRKMDLNDPKTARVGLSFDNVLTDGYSYDGQSIVYPINDDWDAVKKYVQDNLYE